MKNLSLRSSIAALGLISLLLAGCGSNVNNPEAEQPKSTITPNLPGRVEPELAFDLLPEELKLPYNSGMVSISKESAELLRKYRAAPRPLPSKTEMGPQWQDSFNCYNATSYGDAGRINVRYIGGGYFKYTVTMDNPGWYYSILSHLYINGRFIGYGGQSDDFYAITGDEVVVTSEADGPFRYAYGSLSCAASKTSNY